MDFDPMEMADQMKKLVEVWTGLKAQFVEAGWEAVNAEQMCLEIIRSSH